MSVVFILNCDAFDSEISLLKSNKCCADGCHATREFIAVTPYAIDATPENKRLDWELGIQAFVCCGRFNFVRSLSREWWVKKGVEAGLWKQEDVNRLMHKGSWHPTFDRPSNVSPAGSRAVSKTPAKRSVSKCPDCGSSWDQVICNSCGRQG